MLHNWKIYWNHSLWKKVTLIDTPQPTSTTQVVEEAQSRLAVHTLCLEQLYFCKPAVHLYTFIIQVYTCSINPGTRLASVGVLWVNRANWRTGRQMDRQTGSARYWEARPLTIQNKTKQFGWSGIIIGKKPHHHVGCDYILIHLQAT
jgi:hypothetical protein